MSTTTEKQVSSEERLLGRVKWFDNRKGFGFVTENNKDNEIFVHHTGLSVKENCFRTLYPGEYIEFDLYHDEQSDRDYAVNVTGVHGGLLLCENTNTRLMVRRHRSNDDSNYHPNGGSHSDEYQQVKRGNKYRSTRSGGNRSHTNSKNTSE